MKRALVFACLILAVAAGFVGGLVWRGKAPGPAVDVHTSDGPPQMMMTTPPRELLGEWKSVTIDRSGPVIQGHVPQYVFTVGSDRKVRYHGVENVTTVGDQELELDESAVRSIEMLARSWIEWPEVEEYGWPSRHLQTTVITVGTTQGSRTIRLRCWPWVDRIMLRDERVVPPYVREFWEMALSSIDAIEELAGIKRLAGLR